MEKLAKRLNKFNKKYLYKVKTNISSHRLYQKELERQDLFFKLNNDEDFIKFEIIKTSYDNMRAIQKKFYEIKHDLADLWDVISYQERHFLLYNKLSPFMETLKHFYVEDKRYFIAFFDDLINAYYDHEMLMFDNEVYRKFIYDFQKITVSPDRYNILPIKANFSQVEFMLEDEEAYVLFSEAINRFYYYSSNEKLSFGISKPLNQSQKEEIANLILFMDKKDLIVYLIDNELGPKRLIKSLKRMLKKL